MIENPPPGQYPKYYIREKKEYYGMAFDAQVNLGPYEKIHLGRFRSREEAEAVCLKHKETGEVPPKRYKNCKRKPRTAHIKERTLSNGQKRFDVIGANQEQEGPPKIEHVATCNTRGEALEARRVYLESGGTSKRNSSRVPYPRGAISEITTKNGSKAWDARVRVTPYQAISLRRCDTQEEAETLVAEYLRTGIKPPRKALKTEPRIGSFHVRETKQGKRWDVRGRLNEEGKPSRKLHLGTVWSEAEAEEILKKFVETGHVPPKQRPRSRTGEAKPRRSIPYGERKANVGGRGRRGPRTSVSAVLHTIKKGYNLRDHEVEKAPHLIASGCVAKSVEQVRNKELVGLDRNEIWRRLAARAV